ncbi:EAL domain-containing protein [Streptomyces sp. NBC_00683]|uniref:EAL domain-containing protein n=1 Tax=Streptomyces sp. NBC_00683 TaxID=2903670 RepID=UPI002E309CB3|nr:EAL domain-containing protein [Streptomyces sp. NBC_00683]
MPLLRAHRPMAVHSAFVLCLAVLYLAFPGARTPLWALIGLSGFAAVFVGLHLHRPAHRWPWWFLAAGLLSFAAGDTIYNVLEEYLHVTDLFPSAADAAYLATYPFLAVGLLGLLRYRWLNKDLPALLDALIFTGALALLVWVGLMQPLTHVEGLTWQQRAISMAYPLGDVLVLALLLRLLTSSRPAGGNRSVHFLVIGTVAVLGFDILYGILQLNSTWQVGTLLDMGWVFFYAAWGLAALHPSMVEITARSPQREAVLPPRGRLVLLAIATLVAPAILLVEALRGNADDATVIAGFTGVLYLLVLFRLSSMVVAHRKALTRERALLDVSSSLVAGDRPRQIALSCESAVDTLFGPSVPHSSMLLSPQHSADLYAELLLSDTIDVPEDPLAATVGDDPSDSPGLSALSSPRQVSTAQLDPHIAAALGNLPTALVCPLVHPDHPSSGPRTGVLLAAGPEKQLTEIRGSLEILASQAGLAMERITLREEIIRRKSEAYFRTLVRNGSDVILIIDDDDTVRYASPSADAVFGRATLNGVPLPSLVEARDRDRAAQALARTREGSIRSARDHWLITYEGRQVEVEAQCSNLRQDPTVRGLVVTLRNVTEQRALEHELTQRAFHDPLTGLPNRALLLERIERALLRSRRDSTLVCVLFIDLDDFKLVNDSMGHSVGDELLVSVGNRLSATLRRSDTAARLGGDEFAVLMEDATRPLDAELLAAQVVQALSRPFRLARGMVSASVSVGVATSMDSVDTEELLSSADLALYAAKAEGKRRWHRFQPRLHLRMMERHELQSTMDSAIAENQFTLRYQPVVDFADAEAVVGFEALVRWSHLRHGLLPPQQFINIAEESGQINSLGAWVLSKAARDIAGLQSLSEPSVPLFASVNVSAVQFRDRTFPDRVREAVETSGLAPGSLQLELTETALVTEEDQTRRIMQRLRGMGIRIAIDDFGTGFASLRYLREFPIDVIKIDKSFIDNITEDSKKLGLVEGIVRIADTLGLQVIAEGIESAAQRDLLASMGCPCGQGYLFARPMTVEQGELLLGRSGASP